MSIRQDDSDEEDYMGEEEEDDDEEDNEDEEQDEEEGTKLYNIFLFVSIQNFEAKHGVNSRVQNR